ncbi:hypothetical protein SRABI84_04748 [Peribacillus simplex]|nr:hypothetical protein SRABI84_04748 [Peribacillus simplex]
MTVFTPNEEGPIPHIPLMPTGGVNLENLASFFRQGPSRRDLRFIDQSCEIDYR